MRSWSTDTARVDAALAATPRIGFLPPDQRRYADLDRALPIGYDQTNSQPTTVRAMLVALRVEEGMRVLDIGSGSGWTTALLARLVGATGEVMGLERIPELVDAGQSALAATTPANARIEPARSDVLGDPDAGPWDRILVSAQGSSVPAELVEQLADDGLMVLPAGGRLLRVDRAGRREDLGGYLFVPLVTPAGPPARTSG